MDVLAKRRFLRLCQRLRTSFVVQRGFRGAHGLQKLRARARGLADDIQLGLAPMRRHLSAAGAGVVLRTNRCQERFQRRYAEHEAKRAVAIIRINPIDSRAQKEAHRGTNRFVPGAGNLEVDFVLAFELNLTVVEPP